MDIYKEEANMDTERDIVKILVRQLAENPKLKLNAEEKYISNILNKVSLQQAYHIPSKCQ